MLRACSLGDEMSMISSMDEKLLDRWMLGDNEMHWLWLAFDGLVST